MAHIIIPSRRVWTRQPSGAPITDGLMAIGAFNARDGFVNLASGRALTRGSAAAVRASPVGMAATNTAVNQGAWCPVAVPSINAKYIAVWHGVFVGAIIGASPKLVGVSNSTTSQSAAVICIGRTTNDDITVIAKLVGTNVSRTFAVGASGWYGKVVTLIGYYEISTLTVQLLAFVDGRLTKYSSSLSFSGVTAPTILGTEQFVVGTDVIENPTRSPGVQTALAACFCGAIPSVRLYEIAENPWQIFRPRRQSTFIDLGGSGSSLNATAAGTGNAAGTASLSAQIALAAVGISTASGTAAASVSVPLSAAGIAIAGGAVNGQATVTITAAGLAAAAGQAGLSAQVLLAASGAAQAAGNAALATQLNALAAGAAQASGSANLSGGAPGALSASGQAQAAGAAVLTVLIQLQAAGTAQSGGSAAGTVSAPGALTAAGQATAAGWGAISTLVTLTAAGFVQAMGAGAFTVNIPLAAAGAAVAGGSAAATLAGLVRNFRLIAAAPVRVTRAVAGARRLTTILHEVRHGR